GGSSVANGSGGPSFASRLNGLARPNMRQASRAGRSNQLIRAANFSKLVSDEESDGEEYKGGEMMRDEAVGAPEHAGNGFIEGPTMPPPAISDVPPSPYDRIVADLFSGDAPSIDPYWTEPLLRLAKSSSRSLVKQLRPASGGLEDEGGPPPVPSADAAFVVVVRPRASVSQWA
ncbi:hypothetical protein THAOC_11928, partial [Thalassiosira oceanica]